MSHNSFPKSVRIRNRTDFLQLQKRKRTFVSAGAPYIAIDWLLTSHGCPRIGITVTRKQGMSVERNRFKRRVREVFRCSNLRRLNAGVDLQVRPRYKPSDETSLKSLNDISFDALQHAMSDFSRYIESLLRRSSL